MDAKSVQNRAIVEFGNQPNFEFSLHDYHGYRLTEYCVCTDLSADSAKLFSNLDLSETLSLILTVKHNGVEIESLPVIVSRCDVELNDEERFCCNVAFSRKLNCFDLIVQAADPRKITAAA